MKHECQNAAPDCTNGHPQDRSIVGIREICAPCYHKSSRKPLKKGRAMLIANRPSQTSKTIHQMTRKSMVRASHA